MRRLLPLLCLLFALSPLPAAAQTSDFITIGQTVMGEVSAQNIAPSYFFTVEAAGTLYTRLTTTRTEFIPVLLLVNTSDNAVLTTIGGFDRGAMLTAQLTLPAPGQYYLQVQGSGGTGGAFALTLSDVPIVDTTPEVMAEIMTETTPNALLTVAPAPDLLIDLPLSTPISGVVNSAAPQAGYRVSSDGQPLLLTLSIPGEPNGAPLVVQIEDEQGIEVASLRGLPTSAVVLPGGSSYTVTLRYEAVATLVNIALPAGIRPEAAVTDAPALAAYTLLAQPYNPVLIAALMGNRVAALPTEALVPTALPALIVATNTPNAPTPTPQPTASLAPSDIDLALRWNGTYLLITNVSGAPLDIGDLSFDGAARHADADYWEQLGTVNIDALPAGACVGFRPLAYPDAPPLASGCSDLAAWWVSDSLAFWLAADTDAGPGTFEVSYNRQTLVTCYTNAGACSLDMPNG